MKFNFNFKTVDSEKEIKKLVDFIRRFPLNYSNYNDWTEKVFYQLMNGEKQAIISLSEKDLVGDIVSQNIGGGILEIKNLRTCEFLQQRGFAHFMLNQLELEAMKNYIGIFVDTRVDNFVVRNLFKKRGYFEIDKENLYDNFQDVIYYKKLIPTAILKTFNS